MLLACADPLYVEAGAPLPRGEGHTFPSWGCAFGGEVAAEMFLGRPPKPPYTRDRDAYPTWGRHLMECL